MATLVPFRALRPVPEAAARVAAVPYDVVSTDEARALAAGNPLSFLHVSRPEIDLPPGTDPHTDGAYDRAAANLAALRREAPLVVDASPAVYVYRLTMGAHVQTGVAACYAIDEYDRGVIRKHERTRRDKEDDRTRHLIALRAQTGPVFLVYPGSAAIDAELDRLATGTPLFDFTAADGIRHTLWRADEAGQGRLVEAFAAVPALYIADGHHRAASASRARHHVRGVDGPGECDTFLAVAFSGAQTEILAYNRVVKDLNGHSPGSLVDAVRARCGVTDGPALPAQRGHVSMFVDGRWYDVTLPEAPGTLPAAERLDVARLHALVLAPVLGIGDERTDARIDFIGGGRGTAALEARVTSGQAGVAFSMYPVSVDDLMAIADEGGIMPPKSTWFEPKLRDGLLSHLI